MEAEDPLSQLRDIHLPEQVALWPPAPGWWVLLALIIVALFFVYRRTLAAMLQRRKLASVLRELDQAYELFCDHSGFESKLNQAGLDFLAQINTLLKRVTLVMYPQIPIGQMNGSEWLAFLDSKAANINNNTSSNEFSQGAGTALADGIYRRRFDADAQALYQLTKSWIEIRYQEKIAEIRFLPEFRRATA